MARRGVFKIVNKQTGTVYVGSSNTDMDRLIDSYWAKLYSGSHHNRTLQSDFDYYGSLNFEVVIVNDNCYSEVEVRSLRENEIYLNRFNTYNEDVPVHYNGGNPDATFGSPVSRISNPKDNLFDILERSDLSNKDKEEIRGMLRVYEIKNKKELKAKINEYKKASRVSDYTIKHFADLYCKYSEFTDWNRRLNDVVFERRKSLFNSEKVYKSIPVYSLEEEFNKLKSSILNSPPPKSGVRFTVKKLSEKLCATLNFESFDLTDSYTISFDGGKYWIHISTLGEMFAGADLELADDKTIEKTLNEHIKTDNFNKPLKQIIYEYCEYKNIVNYWDMAGKTHIIIFNNNSLEGYLRGRSIKGIIDEVDKGYGKLNEPLDKSSLKSTYYSIRRIFNFARNSPVESLLEYLLKSDLTLKNKLELKKKISTGAIDNEASLKNSIKARTGKNTNIARKEIPTRNRKVIKTNSKKVSSKQDLIECPHCRELNDKNAVRCKLCHYYFKKENAQTKTTKKSSKKKSKNKTKKNQNKKDLIECPHCKELNDKDSIRCKLCHYEFKQNNILHNLIKCPNCGELIKKNAVRCKHCNYYFKQGKVLPKNNIKKEGKINTNNQHKDSNIPSGKKICPECGRIINDYAIRCVSCNHHFKDSEDKKYKKIMNTIKNNVKFCCDCHNEINMTATKCTNCGSESFVYNKNIIGLKYFKIKFDMRAENPWQYIQITDDDKEYTIFAKSKRELKNKIIENHLPWDDKRVEERINVRSDKYYYPKKQSKDRKRYYGTDYDYDEPPSFLYYERDNPTEEELGYFR